MKRFVILDRDGTINVEKHYLSDPDQLELLPGAAAGMRKIQNMGLGIAVVTNQSGIARGYFDLARLDSIHDRLKEILAKEHIAIDGIYICPHSPDDDCTCRKPLPGMGLQAAKELGFDPETAFMIGDKAVDIDLGHNIGAKTFLVRTGYGAKLEAQGFNRADYIVNNLDEAAQIIEKLIVSDKG